MRKQKIRKRYFIRKATPKDKVTMLRIHNKVLRNNNKRLRIFIDDSKDSTAYLDNFMGKVIFREKLSLLISILVCLLIVLLFR